MVVIKIDVRTVQRGRSPDVVEKCYNGGSGPVVDFKVSLSSAQSMFRPMPRQGIECAARQVRRTPYSQWVWGHVGPRVYVQK